MLINQLGVHYRLLHTDKNTESNLDVINTMLEEMEVSGKASLWNINISCV